MAVVCGGCGKENPYGSRFCNSCGREFETLVAPSVGPSAPRIEDEYHGRRCWNCSAPVEDEVLFCTACGTQLTLAETEVRESVRESEHNLYAAVLFCGTGLLNVISAVSILTTDGYLEEYGLDVTGFLQVCGIIVIVSALCAFAASWTSYRRGSFALIMVGGAMGMLGVGPFYLGSILSLIAIIIVAINRDMFD